MFARARTLLTIAALTPVTPVAAQAPAPTTIFDGTYFGVSRTFKEASGPLAGATWTHYCPQPDGRPEPLMIVNGIARSGAREGTVSRQGVLVMRRPNGRQFDGQIDGQGIARGRATGVCSYQLVWQKAPAPTMPFDGDYIGVSGESSGWGAECPPSGVPSTLVIRNSVALGEWQGTLSPQGLVTLRNTRGIQVGGQVDPQSTIRTQYSGAGCITTYVWRKQ